MTRPLRIGTLVLGLATALSGCHPSQPFYLHEDGDLSHYLDHATELEYPDLEHARLAEVEQAKAPLTLSDPKFDQYWDLTLEDAVSIALQNAQVILNLRVIQSFDAADPLINRIGQGAVSTVYDPAIFETDPQRGVEAALSAFDAQFAIFAGGTPASGALWDQRDIPQNRIANPFAPRVLKHGTGQLVAELGKKTAVGTQWFVRNRTVYNRGNLFGGVQGGFQALESIWSNAVEVELRQPLLRGRGTQINRIPVVLARIDSDISLAQFEANVRDLVMDVERAYWNLYCAYRQVDAALIGRDSAQVTWRIVYEKWKQGVEPVQAEAQASEQYYAFRAAVETSLAGPNGLYESENLLRFLMGLAPTDGRLIRPIDEPTIARIEFDWNEARTQSLYRSTELRQQRWRIKQREMQLVASRNQLLPQFDFRAVYQWVGVGDHLINARRNGLNFPDPGSTAFDELTEGNYQQFTLGFDFVPPPIGARRELAGVRNAQLSLARERARLDDMELGLIHLVSRSLRGMDSQYQIAQSHFNRWIASEREVESVDSLYRGGKATLDLLLDAQRRRAVSQVEYYNAVCEFNKAIADVHYRKGSLLDYNDIELAEGPWPQKAYWDALARARQRDASYYLDYGWTRPGVVSRGAVRQQMGSEIPQQQRDAEPVAPGTRQPTPAGDEPPAAPPPQNAAPPGAASPET